MFILKSCPKCRGDLSIEQDNYSRTLFSKETDFACLQCGYRLLADERRAMLARLRRWAAAARSTAGLNGTGGAVPAM
jgi:DNA-directed RNA polymerase subunit RPC12/RpoP